MRTKFKVSSFMHSKDGKVATNFTKIGS